ncbi:Uncharacterised protein [Vibrio cholerae]|nr:Uncharacterised protein [Vibrio cholerae]
MRIDFCHDGESKLTRQTTNFKGSFTYAVVLPILAIDFEHFQFKRFTIKN